MHRDDTTAQNLHHRRILAGSDTGSLIPVDRRASRKSRMRNGRNRGNPVDRQGRSRRARTPYEPPQARSDSLASPPGRPVQQGHSFHRGLHVRSFTSLSDINPTVSRYLSTGLGTLAELAILRITHTCKIQEIGRLPADMHYMGKHRTPDLPLCRQLWALSVDARITPRFHARYAIIVPVRKRAGKQGERTRDDRRQRNRARDRGRPLREPDLMRDKRGGAPRDAAER